MMKIFFILFFFSFSASAIEFEQVETFTISGKPAKGVFHHLESGGRKSIAINKEHIGIVWEDNSSGKNSVYFVSANNGKDKPATAITLADIGYTPVITSIDDGFIVAWENDTTTQLTYIDINGKIIHSTSIGDNQERQISFDHNNTGLLTIWAVGNYKASNIVSAKITITNQQITLTDKRIVDADSPPLSKEFPSILFIDNNKHLVSWQDRRSKTNVLRYSLFTKNKYTQQNNINATVKKSDLFGQGSSAVRGTLATVEKDKILAVWMDKRSERSGYEVFSSLSSNKGLTFFGNDKVQDTFGNEIPQWNASIINNDKYYIVIWNDAREDDQDLYYSYKIDNEWSEDTMFELASVEWDQYAPQAVFDKDNNLHLIWIEKIWSDSVTFVTSIKYSRLKLSDTD